MPKKINFEVKTMDIRNGNLVTLRDLQSRWGISAATIRNWRKRGLRAYRIGRRLYLGQEDTLDFIINRNGVNGIKTRKRKDSETPVA